MADFWQSPAGSHIMAAKQFLEGAVTLDAAQRDKGRVLFRPTLALAGQGLELMLKGVMLINGVTPPKGRKGHDAEAFWHMDVCEPLRGHTFVNAHLIAETDRLEGFYPDVPDDSEVLTVIEAYVLDLAKLHGASDYPLRYPADDANQQAPRTPFLVKTLWRTADDLVKRPMEFELARFRGSK